jgi:H+/Cl- antiporter ClcA
MARKPSGSLSFSPFAQARLLLLRGWSGTRHAAGSGIPHVEAVLRGELPQPPPLYLIPVKFFGGLLAIGAGLALGREGPSVQMGASLAHLVGRVFHRGWPDCRVLIAAGAGAGLGTAFNAPIAGAVFVLEELVQRFEHRIAIAALAASATALGVARVLLGDAPDFHVYALGFADAGTRQLYFVFGAVAGVLAIAYNRALLATRSAALRLTWLSVELRAGLIGAVVGTLGWFAPNLIGRGRPDYPKRPGRQRLSGRHSRRLSDPICPRRSVVCGRNSRGPFCADTRFGSPARLFFWRGLSSPAPLFGSST